MLYDPKWEVKVDPFSLESLVAWLEKQPQTMKYCWGDGGRCLLAQWVRSIDVAAEPNFTLSNIYTYTVNGADIDLTHFAYVAYDDAEWDTFGAALTRAREALAAR